MSRFWRRTKEKALFEAVNQALNVLGVGDGHDSGCKGCDYERLEAKRILIIACARVEGKLCTNCHGRQYVAPAPDSEFDADLCPVCKGTGVRRGYLPPTYRRTMAYVRKRDCEPKRLSSAMCEYGTKTCEVDHAAQREERLAKVMRGQS